MLSWRVDPLKWRHMFMPFQPTAPSSLPSSNVAKGRTEWAGVEDWDYSISPVTVGDVEGILQLTSTIQQIYRPKGWMGSVSLLVLQLFAESTSLIKISRNRFKRDAKLALGEYLVHRQWWTVFNGVSPNTFGHSTELTEPGYGGIHCIQRSRLKWTSQYISGEMPQLGYTQRGEEPESPYVTKWAGYLASHYCQHIWLSWSTDADGTTWIVLAHR